MVGMENLIPRWLRKEEGYWAMPEDELPPPPPVAALPAPEEIKVWPGTLSADYETDDDTVIKAAVLVKKFREKQEADSKEIERLKIELTEAILSRQSDQKKINLLELEITEQVNNIATLQSDLLEKDRCLSLLRQVLDKFGTKAPPKKARKLSSRKQETLSENTAA